jgi:hypothetical protein
MSQDWKDLAGLIAKSGAPILGGLLGGPAGAAIGQLAGSVLGDALNTEPTPAAVSEALNKVSPSSDPILSGIDRHFEGLSQFEAQVIDSVNNSMRQELTAGSAYQSAWRPLAGYVLSALVGSYGSLIVAAGARGLFGVDPGAMNLMSALLNGVGPWTMLVAPLGAVVGVTAWGRSQEKITAIKQTGA